MKRRYDEEDVEGCRAILGRLDASDPEPMVMNACLEVKAENYDEALRSFQAAEEALGAAPYLSYNTALCRYHKGEWSESLREITKVIDTAVTEHPELSVGSFTDGIETRSVGNTQTLRETALVEAFNLKAAIEWQLDNKQAAKEALTDMPPRSEDELDPVTLHNTALVSAGEDP